MRSQSSLTHRAARAGIIAALIAVFLCTGVASAAVDTTKPYTPAVTVTPDAGQLAAADAWAGSVPLITISIRNDSKTQQIGSANIAVPAGIVPDPPLATGDVIQLRNLALPPGGTVSTSLTARIPCVPDASGYAWTMQVRQSNDFNGAGNDFFPSTPPALLFGDGLCSLQFTANGQPASAQRLTNITDDAYLPTSTNPVAVRVADGSGSGTVAWWSTPIALAIAPGFNPGAGTLSGTTSVTPVAGVARFLAGGVGPRIDTSASGYRVTASSTGIAGTAPTSAAFDIVDSGQRCVGGRTCTGSTSTAAAKATVSTIATNDNDLLLLSLGAADAPVFDCAGYTETTPTLAFNVTTLAGGSSGATKTIVYTVLTPTKPAAKYEICFRSFTPFTAASGNTLFPAPQQTDGSYVGLLPGCSKVAGVPPCLTDRATVSGSVVLTVTAPAGDPFIKG